MKSEKVEEKEPINSGEAKNETVGTSENDTSSTQKAKDKEKESVDELTKLQDELAESKDKYLRLYSEFENFRRRTAKEKLDLVQTANQDLMQSLIPVLDDFERAEKSFEKEDADVNSMKEGLNLVYNKFHKTLVQNGLKPMDGKIGMDFDPDFHEAITQIPAPEKKLKGKVVDIIEKGYLLKDKVIRYAKVVTGQ